jgi:hypothetical protein
MCQVVLFILLLLFIWMFPYLLPLILLVVIWWIVSKVAAVTGAGLVRVVGIIFIVFLLCGVGSFISGFFSSDNTTDTHQEHITHREHEFRPRPTPAATHTRVIPTRQSRPTSTVVPSINMGVVTHGGNIRSSPRIAPETVIGQVCPGCKVDLQEQRGAWYRVHVIQTGEQCDPTQINKDSYGWVHETLLSSADTENQESQPQESLISALPATSENTGVVIHGGNIRSAPFLDGIFIEGQVCPDDRIEFVEYYRSYSSGTWYYVIILANPHTCVETRVQRGTSGWVHSTLVTQPYAQVRERTRFSSSSSSRSNSESWYDGEGELRDSDDYYWYDGRGIRRDNDDEYWYDGEGNLRDSDDEYWYDGEGNLRDSDDEYWYDWEGHRRERETFPPMREDDDQ